MPERPPLLSLAGMILILFGAMALMNLVTTELVHQGTQTVVGEVKNPLAEALKLSQGYQVFQKVLLLPKFLVGVFGILIGIGVIKGRETARKAALAWAVAYLALGLTETWTNVSYTREAAASMTLPATMQPDQIEAARQGLINSSLIGAVFSLGFVIALAVALILVLTRRESVAFCRWTPAQLE